MNFEETLIIGAKEFGILLSSFQINNFLKYKEILLEWNKKFNLTSITNERDIAIKH